METRLEELDKRISDSLSEWKLPEGKDKTAVWDKISYSIRTKKRGHVISLKKWHWVAAACVMSVLLSYAVFYSGQITHTTLNNNYQTITLPDGSTVNINAGSQLNYNKYTWLFKRNVNLSGEGFFKVTKGSQFKVHTDNGTIKVLGTSFNVFSRKHKLNVACYEGRVEVSTASNAVVIVPGEEVHRLGANSFEKTSGPQEIKEPNWLKGRFVYSETPLIEVFEEVERQFNVEINTSNLPEKMRFTGEWNTGMDVDNVLDIVCLPFGLNKVATSKGQFKIEATSL